MFVDALGLCLVAIMLGSAQRMARGAKNLYIVRHGQAQHNPRAEAAKADGCSMERFLELMLMDDALDADLTTIGRNQGREAALPDAIAKRIELVVSSPLSRALETADLVLDPTRTKPGTLRLCNEHFREVNGKLLNAKRRTTEELKNKFPAWDFSRVPSDETTWTPELETWDKCAERGYKGLCLLLERPEEDIMLVAHGGLLVYMMTIQPNVKVVDARKGVQIKPAEARFENCEVRRYTLSWDTTEATDGSTDRAVVLTQVDME